MIWNDLLHLISSFEFDLPTQQKVTELENPLTTELKEFAKLQGIVEEYVDQNKTSGAREW